MQLKLSKLILLVFISLPYFALANTSVTNESLECLEIDAGFNEAQLTPYLYHYLDASDQIVRPFLDNGSQLRETTRNISFTPLSESSEESLPGDKSNHWFRFCLRNASGRLQELVLGLKPSTLPEIDFYPQKSDQPSFQTGNAREFVSRDILNASFGFKISLLPQEQQEFFFRINAAGYPFYRRANIADNPFFSATILDRSSYDHETNNDERQFGIIAGVFLSLLLYNLLLLFSAKQKSQLLYTLLISTFFVVLLALKGQWAQYAPSGYARFNNLLIVVFYPVSIFLAALFIKSFLKLKNYTHLNLIGSLILLIGAAVLLASYAYSQVIFAQLCDLLAIIILSYFGAIIPIYVFIKDRLVVAKYILITQAPMILCLFDRALFGLGLTEQYYIPYKIITAAMFLLVTQSYFMGVIAYREKQSVLREANKQLDESNKLKANYNIQLEQELEQKTADIRSMNADLEEQAKTLKRLDESKSKFFANISHEFRTPLTLIEGPLNELLERENYSDKEIISGVVKHSNSLKGLIDQILLLSELDENSLDLKVAKVNVVQVVNEFVAQFDTLFKQKNITLKTESSQAEIFAYIDQEKLQLIINNLLSNAFKFTQAHGSVTVSIGTTAQAEARDEFASDEYVKIRVTDTGLGIPANEINYVFDRYFQSGTSELSKSGIGTGIGLALVKELVELHAGEVSVESSTENEQADTKSGTSFCITFPLGRAHFNDNEIIDDVVLKTVQPSLILRDNIEQQDHEQAALPSNGQRTTILVVDDNEDMRRHIRRLLETEYSIVIAEDGLLAEETLKQQDVDLIITDLMMPNRDGLEFIKSIKNQPNLAGIPIIMLTARAGLQDRLKGLMAAVDDYLVKPFNGRELKTRIHNLLNKHAQFRAFYQDDEQIDQQQLGEASASYVLKVKKIVSQRLIEPDFGVEELAQALHVSEATLRRRLGDQTSFTPAAFIRHCRLDKAKQLCQQGNMRSIEELASLVGFRKASYFSRLYEKTFNQKIRLRPVKEKST